MPYAVSEIQQKREARRKVGDQIRALLKKATDEKRELSGDEREQKEKLFKEGFSLRSEIEEMERLSDLLADDHPASTRKAPPADPEQELPPEIRRETAAATAAEASTRGRNSPEYLEEFRNFLRAKTHFDAAPFAHRALGILKRDLSVDSELQAGILVPPVKMVMEILKDYDAQVVVRGLARRITVQRAKGLGIYKRLAKAATWKWGSELGTPTKDTALKFGARELHPKPAVGEIVVSRTWLREAADMSPEQIVRQEMVRDGAELQEKAFLTGTGANEPLGLYTAHVDGISTARDVSTGNTATAITLAGLRKAKATLRPGYWNQAQWMGGRGFYEQVYGLDDGMGRPLFVESVRVGEPDRVLNFPILLNEFNPDTFTTGLYVAILGAFNVGYIIADSLDMEIERFDDSAYARNNQVGFIGRLNVDGAPVLEEAFVRVKLA